MGAPTANFLMSTSVPHQAKMGYGGSLPNLWMGDSAQLVVISNNICAVAVHEVD